MEGLEQIQQLISMMRMMIWACGGIAAIGAATAVLSRWYDKAKAPEMAQDKRLENLETRMEAVEQHLDNDNKRLNELEKGLKAVIRGLIALLNEHDEAKREKALEDLNRYLIER